MFALVGAGTATSAEPRCRSQGDWLAACARWRTAPRTYSATLSLAAAAASSHRAFSSAGTRMVSVSLMSTVSHTRFPLAKPLQHLKPSLLSPADAFCLAEEEVAFYDAIAEDPERVYDETFLRDLVHDASRRAWQSL